jgi:signal transduction histidine kinase
VTRLEAELAGARATLAEALAARERAGITTDLVSVAAEELRAPATAVSGYLQLMVDGEIGTLAPDQQHMLECAVFHTRRMLELVDDLVMITGLPTGHRQVAKLDVRELVRLRAQDASTRALARQVRLELRLAECPQVVGDRATIGRAVDCLLEQAIMFSPPTASVVCAVHGTSEIVTIEVSDQGMSPDPEALNALMDGRDPGAASDPRTLLASRLGLVMVRMVAEANGGRADAVAEPRRTTVRMVLPACA